MSACRPRRPSRASTSSTSSSPATCKDLGIIVLGGLTNSVLRALARLGLADLFRQRAHPDLLLNVAYPLVPDELQRFCVGKRAVLIVEEGSPDYIEQADQRRAAPRRHPDARARQGRAAARPANTPREVLLSGLAAFLAARHAGRHRHRRRSRAQGRQTARATRPAADHGGRRLAAAPAEFLHRLPGAAGVRRASS